MFPSIPIIKVPGFEVTIGGNRIEGDNNGVALNVDPFFGNGTHVTGDNNGHVANLSINNLSGVRIDGDNNGRIDNVSLDIRFK
uniref:Uncharacterized protein n=1 Tax=Panagrolaimus sp. PS1159 TaxID=55785 RepID=A0AC35GXX3_9BILA